MTRQFGTPPTSSKWSVDPDGGGSPLKVELLPITLVGFSARASLTADDVVVKFVGNGDMEAAPPLATLLSSLLLEANRLRRKKVKLDFTELYFLNSACLKHFASLIAANRKAMPGMRIRLVFFTDSALSWQDRCLEALQYLDTESVVLEANRPQSDPPPPPGRSF